MGLTYNFFVPNALAKCLVRGKVETVHKHEKPRLWHITETSLSKCNAKKITKPKAITEPMNRKQSCTVDITVFIFCTRTVFYCVYNAWENSLSAFFIHLAISNWGFGSNPGKYRKVKLWKGVLTANKPFKMTILLYLII